MMSLVERVWYGDDAAARGARSLLWPLSQAYRIAMSIRSTLYDSGALSSETSELPTVSIGNLTVGGTGKTPFAAWIAGQLAPRASPAIVLRGYGADETEVHRRLNPTVPVLVNADRAAG